MKSKNFFILLSLILSHSLFAVEEPTHFTLNPLPCSLAFYSNESVKRGVATILALDEIPGMHALDRKTVSKGYTKLEEVCNFRYSKDHTYAGFSQPSKTGIENILKFMGSEKGSQRKTLYYDLREEPVIFINGKTYGFRELNKQTQNLFITGITSEQLNTLEVEMKKQVLQYAQKNGGKIKIRKEIESLKNPSNDGRGEIVIEEIAINENNIKTTNETFNDVANNGFNVSFFRIPITDEHAPQVRDVNALVKSFDANKAENKVFHCHFGHGRTTTGLVSATIIDKAGAIAKLEKDLSADAQAIREIAEIANLAKLLKFTDDDFKLLDFATNENSISIDIRHDVLAKKAKGTQTQYQHTLKRYLTMMALTKYASSLERKTMSFSDWLRTKRDVAKVLILQ